MADPAVDAKIAQLQRVFGNQLERDVVMAVLDVCNGDVKQAEAFLTAGQGDFVDPGPSQQQVLPRNYTTRPQGFSDQRLKKALDSVKKAGPLVDVVKKMKDVIFSDGTLQDHFNMHKANPSVYTGVVGFLLYFKVDFPAGSKPKILATALSFQNTSLTNYLLFETKDEFQMIDILRTLKLMDTPRKIKQVETKLLKMNEVGANKKKISTLNRKLAELKNEHKGSEGLSLSVSGSTAKKIRKWVKNIPKENLEFYLMQMPSRPWKDLADIAHPNPTDFQCPYFLATIYGAEPPKGSIVEQTRLVPDLSRNEIEVLLETVPIPFSFLRKNVEQLSIKMRESVSKYESLDILIWWHHELMCDEVDNEILRRLEKGEEPQFSYGKFMERLLYFKGNGSAFFQKLIPIAEKRLKQISLPLEPPCMVIGDASFSMDVAIRTSTIIASLMVVLSNAKLRFFNDKVVEPPFIPKSAEDVIRVTELAKADGLTAPASSIYDLYKKKEKIHYFVMVTDEIENEMYQDTFFAQLFYNYCVEVYPARLVFISFLDDLKVKGRMVQALEAFGIEPLQFKLDAKRPDLTKMDSVLGIISSESGVFPSYVEHLTHMWKPQADLEPMLRKCIAIETPEYLVDNTEEKEAPKSFGVPAIKSPSPISAPLEPLVAVKPKEDKKELFKSADKNMCAVCFEKEVDCALAPCGHAAFCELCALQMKGNICALCREPVSSILKIYRS